MGKEKGVEGDGCALPASASGSASVMTMMMTMMMMIRIIIIITDFLKRYMFVTLYFSHSLTALLLIKEKFVSQLS